MQTCHRKGLGPHLWFKLLSGGIYRKKRKKKCFQDAQQRTSFSTSAHICTLPLWNTSRNFGTFKSCSITESFCIRSFHFSKSHSISDLELYCSLLSLQQIIYRCWTTSTGNRFSLRTKYLSINMQL